MIDRNPRLIILILNGPCTLFRPRVTVVQFFRLVAEDLCAHRSISKPGKNSTGNSVAARDLPTETKTLMNWNQITLSEHGSVASQNLDCDRVKGRATQAAQGSSDLVKQPSTLPRGQTLASSRKYPH